jgi:D-glycero-D-manno-heptose 1,7-bisphosphate phosphatase
MPILKPAAFLDRDGVINHANIIDGISCPPRSLSEVEILPGVLNATKMIIDKGYIPVVITNQPDISRGLISEAQVNEINQHIGNLTGIRNFYVCGHDDSDSCDCRKPKPGMIKKACSELNLNIEKSFLVGDRWKDIAAGQEMNLKNYFIDYSYKEPLPKLPFIRVSSLLEAVSEELGEVT